MVLETTFISLKGKPLQPPSLPKEGWRLPQQEKTFMARKKLWMIKHMSSYYRETETTCPGIKLKEGDIWTLLCFDVYLATPMLSLKKIPDSVCRDQNLWNLYASCALATYLNSYPRNKVLPGGTNHGLWVQSLISKCTLMTEYARLNGK